MGEHKASWSLAARTGIIIAKVSPYFVAKNKVSYKKRKKKKDRDLVIVASQILSFLVLFSHVSMTLPKPK